MASELDITLFKTLCGQDGYAPDFKEAADDLVKQGANVNASVPDHLSWTPYSGTPLHHAINGVWNEQIEWLLENGADVNALDDLGMTPIHNLPKVCRGANEEWVKIAELLLNNEKKLDLNVQDKKKQTVFHVFGAGTKQRATGHQELLEYLLNNSDDIDLTLKDFEGNTPLALAVRRKDKFLISSFESYIASHPSSSSSSSSDHGKKAGVPQGNGGNISSEELKLMKELLLEVSEAVADGAKPKIAGAIRELTYKLSQL